MKKLFLLLISILTINAKTLWVYCGITMKSPIKEMAREFEATHPGVKIKHLFGSSGVLYKKIITLKKADLYLPGSPKFIKKNPSIFSKKIQIGYNQLYIFVKKGNPKNIKSLEDFKRNDVEIGLGNLKCSVGKASKTTLIRYKGEKFFKNIYSRANHYYSSKEIIESLKADKVITGSIDIALNWKATYYWRDNKNYIDIIPINEVYAPKKALILTITSFSKNKDLATQFLEFAASPKGKEIMKKWGFR
jgi:molybdate transport system substrate-binding protein